MKTLLNKGILALLALSLVACGGKSNSSGGSGDNSGGTTSTSSTGSSLSLAGLQSQVDNMNSASNISIGESFKLYNGRYELQYTVDYVERNYIEAVWGYNGYKAFRNESSYFQEAFGYSAVDSDNVQLRSATIHTSQGTWSGTAVTYPNHQYERESITYIVSFDIPVVLNPVAIIRDNSNIVEMSLSVVKGRELQSVSYNGKSVSLR